MDFPSFTTDFSRLEDGRILDLRLMASGGWPKVSADGGKTWTDFEGILGQITDSIPLSIEEKASLSSEAHKPRRFT